MTGGDYPLPTDHFVEPSPLEFYLFGRLEAKDDPNEREDRNDTQQTQAAGLIGGAGYQVSTLPEEMGW